MNDSSVDVTGEQVKRLFHEAERMAALTTLGRTLFDRLYRARRALSVSESVPAFRVLPNSVMLSLAENPPVTIEDLTSVKGMGPIRVRRYGGTIMACLSARPNDGIALH